MSESGLIRVGGLWKKESSKGPFYQGRLGNLSLVLFKNDRKEGDQNPDLIMYLGKAEKKAEGATDA